MSLKMSRPDGTPIRDWRSWTPPKDPKHWRAGRSALELARAWFMSQEPVCPEEVRVLLATSPGLSDLTLVAGTPEVVTPLPEAGEGRNHDLVLEGVARVGRVLITVEAKGDESFGNELIGGYWGRKRDGREGLSPVRSRAPERIESLLTILLGGPARPSEPPWSELRYQLLTAAVGTLLEAKQRQADLAVPVVHEFKTTETDLLKQERNALDFWRFLEALHLCDASEGRPGQLYGPHAAPLGLPPLLIGKAVCDWGAPS